jgi:hypothetical protein
MFLLYRRIVKRGSLNLYMSTAIDDYGVLIRGKRMRQRRLFTNRNRATRCWPDSLTSYSHRVLLSKGMVEFRAYSKDRRVTSIIAHKQPRGAVLLYWLLGGVS